MLFAEFFAIFGGSGTDFITRCRSNLAASAKVPIYEILVHVSYLTLPVFKYGNDHESIGAKLIVEANAEVAPLIVKFAEFSEEFFGDCCLDFVHDLKVLMGSQSTKLLVQFASEAFEFFFVFLPFDLSGG